MKIVVCVKQVPDTVDVKWTDENTMIRDGIENILNPCDEYALEAALKIKDKFCDSKIVVVSMGIPQSELILRKCIAMGADEAILLTDKRFSGSDTVATARTLAACILNQIGAFDIILCGQFAVDGDTAQTGPGIAENLNIPQVTYVDNLNVDEYTLLATRKTEYTLQTIKINLPVLVCITKSENFAPRKPFIKDWMRAKHYKILTYNMEDLLLTPDDVGIKGSPTMVLKAFKPDFHSDCQIINEENPEKAVENLMKKIDYDKSFSWNSLL